MSAAERERLEQVGRAWARTWAPISDETARNAARILASAPSTEQSAA